MNDLGRIISDVFTLTLLLSASGGTLLGFINRRGEQKAVSWLYMALMFFCLSLLVLFDNALAWEIFNKYQSLNWRVSVVTFCFYGIVLFANLFLKEEFCLSPKSSRWVFIPLLLLLNAPLVSLLTIKNGMAWYKSNLAIAVMGAFGLSVIFTIVFFGILLIRKKYYRRFRILTAYGGVFITGSVIYTTKVILETRPALYQNQSYIVLAVILQVYLILLSRQSYEEFRELRELRRAMQDRQEALGEDRFQDLIDSLQTAELPFSASQRERCIIQGLCNGLLYKEIADKLQLSLSSIKKGAHGIYKKAGVQNRVELLRLLAAL